MDTVKVYKIGGNVVDDMQMLENFCKEFATIEGPKILVHGGGVIASRMQEDLGQKAVKIAGRRVTDEDTLKVVTMAYSGWCNKTITSLLQKHGCNAIGMSGCDGNVITAAKRAPMMIDGVSVDFGYVGDVNAESVNADLLKSLLNIGLTPVLCAINHDGKGTLLNTNADTIASSVAIATKGDLYYLFEKDGVLRDKDDNSSIISSISQEYYLSLKAEGIVADGMIPKLDNSFKAIEKGVGKVVIKNAKNLLNEVGTTLCR